MKLRLKDLIIVEHGLYDKTGPTLAAVLGIIRRNGWLTIAFAYARGQPGKEYWAIDSVCIATGGRACQRRRLQSCMLPEAYRTGRRILYGHEIRMLTPVEALAYSDSPEAEALRAVCDQEGKQWPYDCK